MLFLSSDLRTAHQLNDKAVMEIYGFNVKMTKFEYVNALMKMSQELNKN